MTKPHQSQSKVEESATVYPAPSATGSKKTSKETEVKRSVEKIFAERQDLLRKLAQ